MRAAGTAEDRAELTRRILALPETFADGEALHLVEPGKITRLEEVARATALCSQLVCPDLPPRSPTRR